MLFRISPLKAINSREDEGFVNTDPLGHTFDTTVVIFGLVLAWLRLGTGLVLELVLF